jgi:hypothetical protein
MSITLNVWTPRGGNAAMTRIYVSGLAGKAYLSQVRGRIGAELSFPDGVDDEQAEKLRLVDWLRGQGIDLADAHMLKWSPILALAERSKGRPTGSPGARVLNQARGSGKAPDRLVHHGMDLTSIPLEIDVLVRLDHREPEALATMLRQHPRVRVEIMSMEIGDILIESNGKTIVGRAKDHDGFRGQHQRRPCLRPGAADRNVG